MATTSTSSPQNTVASVGKLLAKESKKMAQLRVCIVADEGSSAPHNWNITPLVEELSQANCQVTILTLHSTNWGHLSSRMDASRIRFTSVHYEGPSVSSLLPAVQSYQVMQWLLNHAHQFDVVHFPLAGGLAYYTLLAKHQGWAFEHLIFCVESHASTLWHKHIHKQWIDHINDLALDFLEQECVRLADGLLSQNEEWLNWVKVQGWKLPEHLFFISKEEKLDYCMIYQTIQDKRLQNKRELSLSEENEFYPLVSLCLTHFNRPHYLAQALESIHAQDYPNFEVILVDDASTQPEAIAYLNSLNEEFRSKGWKIIRNKQNLFPGAARNLAARESRGEYLLFMDDDNYAKSNEISTFIRIVKHVNADILTCAMDVFIGSKAPEQNSDFIHRFLPIGAVASVGLYLNMFGDMNALIKKTVYQALNGLTEEKGVGGEDWELYSRAVLEGYHLETIPLALFWYRDTPNSITKTTHLYGNSLRGIRSYLLSVPPPLRANLILGQAQQEKLQKLLVEYNHLGMLLKRCWKLFSSRARRAIRHPRRMIKKILGK